MDSSDDTQHTGPDGSITSDDSLVDRLSSFVHEAGERLLSAAYARVSHREFAYRLWLRYEGYDLSPRLPAHTADGAVLQDDSEYEQATAELRRCGLVPHGTPSKNWDHLAALTTILDRTDDTARVLDAGGEIYSPLVHWLYLFGYRDLHVCNLSFDEAFRRGPIRYQPQDITDTSFPNASFDAVTCLSVIEHGVDVDAFLTEAHRILRPGGQLLVSTDYWPDGVDSDGVSAYGLAWDPFDADDLTQLVERAEAAGFRSTTDVDVSVSERPVSWRGYEYTFALLQLEKTV